MTRPFTFVLLARVAFDAITGPPALMLGALKLTVPIPASMVPGVSVPIVCNVIPPVPVAVTAPVKLFAALASAIVPAPA